MADVYVPIKGQGGLLVSGKITIIPEISGNVSFEVGKAPEPNKFPLTISLNREEAEKLFAEVTQFDR